MRQTINKSQFMDAFRHAGRGDQFSYDGLSALYDYLEENYPDYDLDIIELCCDYSELSIDDLESETGFTSVDRLAENTFVIMIDSNNLIYQNF